MRTREPRRSKATETATIVPTRREDTDAVVIIIMKMKMRAGADIRP